MFKRDVLSPSKNSFSLEYKVVRFTSLIPHHKNPRGSIRIIKGKPLLGLKMFSNDFLTQPEVMKRTGNELSVMRQPRGFGAKR